ncbi:hypothetical protein [Methylorubrum sp. POS3]|uniref:hypothetical protein n=1 Tax=Methylorubrum sp. POS3 TaxID=2998492 RepID=UPI0037274C43
MEFIVQFVSFLEKWQTLIAGILAIFGAWATLKGVDRQIAQIKDSEDRQLKRRFFCCQGSSTRRA